MRECALLLAASLCTLCSVEWTLVLGNSQLFRLLANLASLVPLISVLGVMYMI